MESAQRNQPRLPLSHTLPGTQVDTGTNHTNISGPASTPAPPKPPLASSRFLPREPLHAHQAAFVSPEEEARIDYGNVRMRKEPIDPRDHSLLELIYNEMHAARFINLEPLVILRNALPLFFNGSYLFVSLFRTAGCSALYNRPPLWRFARPVLIFYFRRRMLPPPSCRHISAARAESCQRRSSYHDGGPRVRRAQSKTNFTQRRRRRSP